MERTAKIERNTLETQITLELNIDGKGIFDVECPIAFLSHLLAAFCKHGMFDLHGKIAGDLDTDQHHTIEDTGITLGMCFATALGDMRGIYRAGCFVYPMDETLCRAAVDFGGRPYLVCEASLSGIPLVSVSGGKEGSFQTDCFEDFWHGFVSAAKCSLHLDTLRGRSDHHKMEGLFKAAARAMRQAVEIDARRGREIPSTKGVIGRAVVV